MPNATTLTRALAIAVLVAACGTKSSSPTGASATSTAPATASAVAADGPEDRCEVHVTGDETFSFVGTRPRGQRGGGKIVAETDYWMTDDELRQALSVVASLGKKSSADTDAEVTAGMAKDPRFMLLIVNCGVDGQGFFNLSPTNGSRYEDVPFEPATYRLASNHTAKPGDFRAMLSIEPGGKRAGFSVIDGGTVELTRFDDTGIAGTFAFDAVSYSGDKKVKVTGRFDYGCGAGSRCKR